MPAPQRRKTDEELVAQLRDALEIIAYDADRLADFPLAWQSIATQHRKIFFPSSGHPALVDRVLPAATFHPSFAAKYTERAKSQQEADGPVWIMCVPFKMTFDSSNERGHMSLQGFDMDMEPTLSRTQWLEQPLFTSQEQVVRVGDLIRAPADKEAVHADPDEPPLLLAMKDCVTYHMGGRELSSYAAFHGVLAAYVVWRLSDLLGPPSTMDALPAP